MIYDKVLNLCLIIGVKYPLPSDINLISTLLRDIPIICIAVTTLYPVLIV
jgi:hypothetical protein